MRVGYLGPPGTFAEEALLSLIGPASGMAPVPFPSVIDCFRAVAAGEVPEALVPIENSLEGSVNQTLDQLALADAAIVIRAEVVHPVRHHLIARRPIAPGDVRRILSHPHAPPQCQTYIRANLPTAEIVAANSTADAVRTVASAVEPWAAIGTLRAADIYGCAVIAADIEDSEDNSTRFVLIGRETAPAVGPGRFRSSIVCALERDRPGALLAILQEFALRAVNLSKLESRPAKTSLGRYVFFIDIEGSRERDLAVDAAITAIEEQGVARVTFLGSYPAAGPSG
ncbi:MAG: prephenate dehydratase [Miltoncostaeaceae bacterium]|nr:prephenate dehydratase [Miltoncostaeaceae bacterium]